MIRPFALELARQAAAGLGLTDAEIDRLELADAAPPAFVDPRRDAADLDAWILTADGWRPLRRAQQGDARR